MFTLTTKEKKRKKIAILVVSEKKLKDCIFRIESTIIDQKNVPPSSPCNHLDIRAMQLPTLAPASANHLSASDSELR